jgi:hypothetical protein
MRSTATSLRSWKERSFVDVQCAVCEESLDLALRGEWILPFSCGHVSHETCFYEYIHESESHHCPMCDGSVGSDASRGKELDNGEKFQHLSCSSSRLLMADHHIGTLLNGILGSGAHNGQTLRSQQDPKAKFADRRTTQHPTKQLEDILEVGVESLAGSNDSLGKKSKHLSVGNASTISREVDSELASMLSRAGTSGNQRRKSSSVISISSLRTRLSNRSSSSVQHVHSVLRMSSSNSWRSSTSWRSSWKSMASAGLSIVSASESVLQRVAIGLSKGEQEVWDEIIDESQLVQVPAREMRPSYLCIAPFKRNCCGLVGRGGSSCIVCGFSSHHARASIGDPSWYGLRAGYNQRDYFRNTPLHYAAASGHATPYRIIEAIKYGADVRAKNTSGQSFMHVLDTRAFQDISGYVILLRHLNGLNFPFSDRDCHGRTIMHGLLQGPSVLEFNTARVEASQEGYLKALSEIFLILQPDMNALDNYGDSVGDLLALFRDEMNLVSELPLRGRVLELMSLYQNPLSIDISFRKELSSKTWKADAWIERLKKGNLVSWIDVHGDTPLTAILKRWKNDYEELQLRDITEQLINLGADVNMRDKNGYAALAIATIRGSRPCVAVLLSVGAMPNSRNYRGTGIIAAATVRMLRASKEGKDKCYAGIFSCLGLLVDYGARMEPTEHEEWLPPTGLTRTADRDFINLMKFNWR